MHVEGAHQCPVGGEREFLSISLLFLKGRVWVWTCVGKVWMCGYVCVRNLTVWMLVDIDFVDV